MKFTSPVLVNNEVTARMIVEKINEEKKIVTFQTILTNDTTDKVAIKGEGTFIIPQLKVIHKLLKEKFMRFIHIHILSVF